MVPSVYWEPDPDVHAEARKPSRAGRQRTKELSEAARIELERQRRDARLAFEAKTAQKIEAGRFRNGDRVWHEELSKDYGAARFQWQSGKLKGGTLSFPRSHSSRASGSR